MKKIHQSEIEYFIENELKGREESLKIENVEIEDKIYIAELNGDFTKKEPIEMCFKIINEKIHILYDDLEIPCDTREFWIVLMEKIYNK